jgi:hypothetical protein
MGAGNGVPCLANDGGAKAHVHSFGAALHDEFKPLGVYVTVLPVGLTDTPVLAKLGMEPQTMPMKPMKVEQCVSEGFKALQENRSMIVPGRLNRIMNALVPASLAPGGDPCDPFYDSSPEILKAKLALRLGKSPEVVFATRHHGPGQPSREKWGRSRLRVL